MSFLTELPPNFASPELQQLRDLFAQAYGSLDEAQALAESAGFQRQYFPINKPNMRLTWTALIDAVMRHGKLVALVEKAAADESNSGYHERFAEMLQANPPVARPGPSLGAGWWKGDDSDPNTARKVRQQRLLAQRSRLIGIDIARQVARVSQSVAKLTPRFANGKSYGTGFLIQPNLMLTNEHVLVQQDLGPLESVDVEFDYEERFSGTALVRKGLINTLQMNKANDWAIIALESAVDRETIALGTNLNFGKDDPVIIIQHPIGAFKKFALDMRSTRYVDDNIIQYLADTQHGSSGSPVFNIDMHVIALHHAETDVPIPPEQNGGVGTVEWRNQGIRIERVMRDLSDRNIPYRSLPAGS